MLFIDEEEYLSQLNFIFVREKSQNLKYQVDYHLHSDEYKDLITGIIQQ